MFPIHYIELKVRTILVLCENPCKHRYCSNVFPSPDRVYVFSLSFKTSFWVLCCYCTYGIELLNMFSKIIYR